MPSSPAPFGAFARSSNPFTIDEEGATNGYLYVEVDGIGTLVIYRGPGTIGVDIHPRGVVDDQPVAALQVADRQLLAARALYQRKKRS